MHSVYKCKKTGIQIQFFVFANFVRLNSGSTVTEPACDWFLPRDAMHEIRPAHLGSPGKRAVNGSVCVFCLKFINGPINLGEL